MPVTSTVDLLSGSNFYGDLGRLEASEVVRKVGAVLPVSREAVEDAQWVARGLYEQTLGPVHGPPAPPTYTVERPTREQEAELAELVLGRLVLGGRISAVEYLIVCAGLVDELEIGDER